MNALLDFVGIVSQAPEKQGEHRIFAVSVTAYAGKDESGLIYDLFTAVCVLPPGERWKRVEPRPGRSVQVQGNIYFPLLHLSEFSID